MRLEIALAKLVAKKIKFTILLPDLEWYTPIYEIFPLKLEFNNIIGHVELLSDGPSLVISKIVEQIFENEEYFALEWPSSVITQPIQHGCDNRKLEELPVNQFEIRFGNIQCHFFKWQSLSKQSRLSASHISVE